MSRVSLRPVAARAFALQLLLAAPLAAQNAPAPPMDHEMPMAAHDLMMRAREGSGTAWLPDESPMAGLHATMGSWVLILHGSGFLQYVQEPGPRGGRQLGSINWVMGMARRPLLSGTFGLRAMLSAEPFTIPRCGYPVLLAGGESCEGKPHDVQHPHDAFTELAAEYTRELLPTLDFHLYAALAGEPALGPVAFPHRWSAMPNPLAPISHHWFDGSHVTFGVVTGGLYGERWKLEGSLFNGRAPDEERLDLDLAPLNSFAARLWWLPDERWAVQLSAGRFNEAPGAALASGDLVRYTTSATYHERLDAGGLWATTAAAGRSGSGARATHALLLESSVTLRERHTFFGRAEWAEVSEASGHHHGQVTGLPEAPERAVGVLALGYTLHLKRVGGLLLGMGGRTSVNFLPTDLEPIYGGRNPMGFAVFLNLRPAETVMETMQMPMGGAALSRMPSRAGLVALTR